MLSDFNFPRTAIFFYIKMNARGRAGRIDGGAEQRYLITLRAHFGTEQRYFLTKGSKRTDEVGAPLRG